MSTEPEPGTVDTNASAQDAGVPAAPPRSLLFSFLARLWIFPTCGAVWILVTGRALWQRHESLSRRLEAISLEQWLAIALLLAHVLFIGLAIHFRRAEQLSGAKRHDSPRGSQKP